MVNGTACSRTSASRRFFVATLSFVLATSVGCSGSSDQPELGLVSGTVTLNGSPLSGVAVTFRPDDGRPAVGKTDSEGNYQLTYIRDTLGCKIGHNRVEIGNSEESGEVNEQEGEQEGDNVRQDPKKRANEIPARYNVRSELEADVKVGENKFNFDLKS